MPTLFSSLLAVLSTALLLTTSGRAAQDATMTATQPSPTAEARRDLVIEDGGTGLHKAIATEDPALPGMTLYRPRDLSPFKGKTRLPVLLWGNGACANTTQEHRRFLNELASQGYLVIGIGLLDQIEVRGESSRLPTNSAQLLQALDWITAQASTPGSLYQDCVDTRQVAAMGMSCGGLQAIQISGDPRIRTTVVCNSGVLPTPSPMKGMPALTKEVLTRFHAPVLYIMGGASDIAYKNAMDDFARIDHVPVVMTNLDVGHGGTYHLPHGGEFTRVALAWLDWQLKGRSENAHVFLGEDCELRKDGKWTVEARNFETQSRPVKTSSPSQGTAATAPLPEGLRTEFVYEATVEIAGHIDVGDTSAGHRRYIPITGGTFEGARLQGTVLPGGADWQVERRDGVTEVNALYSMKCDDGTVIIVHNSGVISNENGWYARTAPRFEVPQGAHAWLTRAQFVGSVSAGPRPGTVTIRVFRVL